MHVQNALKAMKIIILIALNVILKKDIIQYLRKNQIIVSIMKPLWEAII